MALHEFVANIFTSSARRRRTFAAQEPSARVTELLETRSLLTSLIGAEVTVASTLESSGAGGTGGLEIPVGDPAYVTVEDGPEDLEVQQIQGIFDVDIDGNRISVNSNVDPNLNPDPTGVIPAGTFRRLYLEFSGLPDADFIASVTADPSRSLVPFAGLVDPNTILIEFRPGMQIGSGFNAVVNVDVQQTPYDVIGQDFTVRNTFQSALGTSGVEVPIGDPVTATITNGGSGPELTSFNGIYDIDVENGGIHMNFNLAGGAPDPSRVIEAGTFDRYYFDLELGPNVSVSGATADPSQTLVPNVSVNSSGEIVVEIGPGMQIGDGFDAHIDFEVQVNGATVSGTKWQDLNNDGIRSSNEGFLNGWEIQLKDDLGNVVDTTFTRNIDLNHDGVIDPETEKGLYQFTGVQDGTYLVDEVLQAGWMPTHPASPAEMLAWELNRDHGLEQASNNFENWGGLGEKWVFGNGQWFYITPDGAFYRWNGSPRTALTGDFLGQLDSTFHSNPALLYDAPPPSRNTAEVTNLGDVSDLNFGNYIPPPEFSLRSVPTESGNTLGVNWTEVAPGLRYDVWITDINTRRQFHVARGIMGDELTLAVPERSYRVWTRTEAAPGVWSAWSASQEIEFKRPPVEQITNGLDAGIDGTPTISWDAFQVPANPTFGVPAQTASSYNVRVTDATGNQTYLATGIIGTRHRIATIHPLGTYYVSVSGNFADGSCNEWGMGQRLIIDGRPQAQISGGLISWAAVKAANEYQVWVDRVDADGNRLQRQIVYVDNITDLSLQLPNLPRGHYAGWVRAIRAEGGDEYPSFWSRRINFTVDAQGFAQREVEPSDVQTVLVSLRAESTDQHEPQSTPVERADEQDSAATPRVSQSDAELVNAVMEELADPESPQTTESVPESV